MNATALIDGDEVALKSMVVHQTSVDWDGDGEPVVSHNLQASLRTARDMITTWRGACKVSNTLVIVSPRGRTNFRKRVLPTYKAHRVDEKPEVYWEIVEWMQQTYDFVESPEGLEADDVLGIYGTQLPNSTICSSDKDFATVPCRWLRPLKGSSLRPTKVNAKMADFAWMKQTLTGDAVDGYKGCPKIGPVNADKILAPHFGDLGAMWAAVVKAFEKAKLTEEHALAQARCARILRYGDADLEKGVVYLWHPKTKVPIHMEPTK